MRGRWLVARLSAVGAHMAAAIDVTGNDVASGGYDVVATGTMQLVRTTCGKSAKIRYWSQEEYDIVGSFGCTDD